MSRGSVLLLALLVPAAAGAEIGAGTVELRGAGQLGFEVTIARAPGEAKVETRRLGLQVGALEYQTTRLGLGGEVSLLKTTRTVSGVSTDGTSTSIAPRLGLVHPVGQDVALFGEALVGWAEDKTAGRRASGVSWGLGAGVKWFLASAVSLDVGLHYRGARLEVAGGGGTARGSSLFAGLGLSGYLFAK